MRNFIVGIFMASFALTSLAMDNEETADKNLAKTVMLDMSEVAGSSLELDLVMNFARFLDIRDRTSLGLTRHNYGESVQKAVRSTSEAYKKQVESLLDCQSIFGLTKTHFDFFRHIQKYFPQLFNMPNIDGMTALHKAVVKHNEIATYFLLALDVGSNIPVMIQDENGNANPKTAADLLRKNNVNSFESHFSEPWMQRSINFNKEYDHVWRGDIFQELKLLDYIVDLLVNCPNGGEHMRAPVLEMYLQGYSRGIFDMQYVSLFINAGSYCDLEGVLERFKNRGTLVDDFPLNLLQDKRVASKKAIEKGIRLLTSNVALIGHIEYGKKSIPALESLLFNLRGAANINAADNQENALLIALRHFKAGAGQEKLDNVTRLAHLLLDKGADPHYKLSRTIGGAEDASFSPIIQLLENSNSALYSSGRERIHFYECFIELLEHCKKTKFVLEDFKQLLGT